MGQWRCLYNDSKVFRGEQFLDQHMANRHAAQIPAGADVCLADWCDVLLCDLAAAPAAWRCPHDGLEQARHRCRQAIERCAPASDPAAARLRGSLERHLCSHLTCAGTGPAHKAHRGRMPAQQRPRSPLCAQPPQVCFAPGGYAPPRPAPGTGPSLASWRSSSPPTTTACFLSTGVAAAKATCAHAAGGASRPRWCASQSGPRRVCLTLPQRRRLSLKPSAPTDSGWHTRHSPCHRSFRRAGLGCAAPAPQGVLIVTSSTREGWTSVIDEQEDARECTGEQLRASKKGLPLRGTRQSAFAPHFPAPSHFRSALPSYLPAPHLLRAYHYARQSILVFINKFALWYGECWRAGGRRGKSKK